jgi:hypothetical protein
MFNLSPQEWLIILAVAIWIDGLWLIKAILSRPVRHTSTAVTIEGKPHKETNAYQELNYNDPFDSKL